MTDESRVQKVPRTKIEDLPQAGEELSEEEASLAAGGSCKLNVRVNRHHGDATQGASTATANELGSDTDYDTD